MLKMLREMLIKITLKESEDKTGRQENKAYTESGGAKEHFLVQGPLDSFLLEFSYSVTNESSSL